MKISAIDFPNALLTALRNSRLVIFAGAGVSMGEPACLPNFKDLANAVAQGTGEAAQEHEPEDRFLGRLNHKGVDVHALAAEKLKKNYLEETPKPTKLHRDLLRLYAQPGPIRVVTTNFDLLFEDAATDAFSSQPEVFRAPALPLGRSFNGIVHIHGTVNHPADLVLTDANFGRAYLTDAWAARFLVDLFRSFTVLFVGYRHNDTVMNYLARALAESETGHRFVLTDNTGDERWKVLGINAITYPRSSGEEHIALCDGIRALADHVTRGTLGWQHEITEIASKSPPFDEERAGLIDEAFSDSVKTRFFTDAAISFEWIHWLDDRGHCERLFDVGDLHERDIELAQWLAQNFAIDQSNDVFLLIARHGMQLNRRFWSELARKVASQTSASPDVESLSRWTSLLLATVPVPTDNWILGQLGKRCSDAGLMNSLVEVFDAMLVGRLVFATGHTWLDDQDETSSPRIDVEFSHGPHAHSWIEDLWNKGLKPNLTNIAEVLLPRLMFRLTARHHALCVWQQANHDYDPESYRRSAIEPHEQNHYPKPIDALIDAARDCLEWLASNRPKTTAHWCVEAANADAPLLRRLAVHALTARQDLTPNKKIAWLLARMDVHDSPLRHEMFQIMQQNYPHTGQEQRKATLEAILAYRSPIEKNRELHTANHHFNWLQWLTNADPNCVSAKQALDHVWAQYPGFLPRQHPDLTHWVSPVVRTDQQQLWTPEDLLSRPASEWLEQLLSFQQVEFLGPDRSDLRLCVSEAAEQKFEWGLDLADQLIAQGAWDTHIWIALLNAWSKARLTDDSCQQTLFRLHHTELHESHYPPIARFLCRVTERSRPIETMESLASANEIATNLWDYFDRNEPLEGQPHNWLNRAINHPAGDNAQFWLNSLSLSRNRQDATARALSDEYDLMLSKIAKDDTLVGMLGRTVLARAFHFLLDADEKWTKQNLLPWFYSSTNSPDFIAVWEGFLNGYMSISAVETMKRAFLEAATKLQTDFSDAHLDERFVEAYAYVVFLHIENPLQTWIPIFFQNANDNGRRWFAFHIGQHLRELDHEQQRECWQRWLRDYWRNRLAGVPQALVDQEIENMLQWTPHLHTVFSEAVDLSICMPIVELQDGFVLDEIAESNLHKTHPSELARLLIYLGDFDLGSDAWAQLRLMLEELLNANVSVGNKNGLRELIARQGLS